MRTIIIFCTIINVLWIQQAKSQAVSMAEKPLTNRSFPLIVSLQFQTLSMPFKDARTLFSNVGVSIGTEFSYSRLGPFHQDFSVGYYHNRNAGDGLFANTQTVYRPKLIGSLSGELRAGLGWAYAFNPTAVYKYENGNWHSVKAAGSSRLMIPLGIGLSLQNLSLHSTSVSPFITYQFFGLMGKEGILFIPNTLLQVGSRIQL